MASEADKHKGLHEDYTYSKYRCPRRREGLPGFGTHEDGDEVRHRRRSSEESLDGDRRASRERASPSSFSKGADAGSPDAIENRIKAAASAASKRRKSSTTGLLDDAEEVLAYEREGEGGKRRSLPFKLIFLGGAFCLWSMWVLGVRWLVDVLTTDEAGSSVPTPFPTEMVLADAVQDAARGGNTEIGQ